MDGDGMKGQTILAVGLLGAGAWYLLLRKDPTTGTPVFALVPSGMPTLNDYPQSPTPFGPHAANTNPLMAILEGFDTALRSIRFKQPGNAPASPATPTGAAAPSTRYFPPPAQAPPLDTRAVQPPNMPGFPPEGYYPSAADPNLVGWPGWAPLPTADPDSYASSIYMSGGWGLPGYLTPLPDRTPGSYASDLYASGGFGMPGAPSK